MTIGIIREKAITTCVGTSTGIDLNFFAQCSKLGFISLSQHGNRNYVKVICVACSVMDV